MFFRNQPFLSGLALALWCFLGATPLPATAQTPPSGAPSPAELDVPYSSENPTGPQFTDEERQRQLLDGARIRREIVDAFNEGRVSYTIPPGNYRFDSTYSEVSGNAFALRGLHGDPARPFRILGYGATFWFNLTDRPAAHYHQMIKIFECSHLALEGLTVDSDPRGSMDAKITAFDFEGNRIQVKPVAGTRLITRVPEHENRFIPYKANGHHIAALYQIDTGWGPGNVFYEKMERTAEGLYWFTLRNRKLLETAQNPQWRAVYGPEGTLEIGDMLGFVYIVSSAITLLDCKQITVRDLRSYAAKAGLVERGGYGGHHWLNCSFMARPGTNNLLGGDGTMSSCMHGSTFDGCVVQRTTDDCFNSYGPWYHAEGVTEHSITFRNALPHGLAPGFTAHAFETRTDAHLGKLTVERVEGKTVTFREPVGPRFGTSGVLFAEFQNAGWVIRNSVFSDCYQRIRLMCGPGVFENNLVERVGAGLTFGNGRPVDPEGGLSNDVVLRNNVFIDSGTSPVLCAIEARTHCAPMHNLEISGNVVFHSGSEAVHVSWCENLRVSDNLLLHSGKGEPLRSRNSPSQRRPAGMVLERIRGGTVSGNLMVSPSAFYKPLEKIESEEVLETGTRAVEDAGNLLESQLRELTRTHDRSPTELLKAVRALLQR